MSLLEIDTLAVQYHTLHGAVQAVRGVTLSIERGRAVGLGGESGCGKAALARALSGGMKQRVVIAMALALDPQLVIADEPVTALDVIVQHQVLRTLRELQETLQLSLLLITHDISVVADLCDDVAVMYAGRIVEAGSVREVFAAPHHPYTMGLRNAFPSLRARSTRLVPIEGYPPDLASPPAGCAFAPRCPLVIERCWHDDPALLPTTGGRLAACHRAAEADALRTQAPQAFARLETTGPQSVRPGAPPAGGAL